MPFVTVFVTVPLVPFASAGEALPEGDWTLGDGPCEPEAEVPGTWTVVPFASVSEQILEYVYLLAPHLLRPFKIE